MVSAARRPARAGFGRAKLSAIKMATVKIRQVACNAVWCEFIRGFISGVPFEKRADIFIISSCAAGIFSRRSRRAEILAFTCETNAGILQAIEIDLHVGQRATRAGRGHETRYLQV